jgi:hypothetical protein
MSEKRVIICDGCNRALGIPAHKTSLEVTCPRRDCKARFFWRLDTNQPDLHKLQSADYVRKLTGVCAGKKRFKIVFVKQRTDPYYRFSHNEPIHSYKYEPDDFSTSLWDEEERFSGREFDFTYDCFHCRSKKTYVYCNGCNHLVCGSQRSFDKNGKEQIYCPICENNSSIITTACTYVGSTSDLRKTEKKVEIATPQKQKLGAGTARSNFRALPPKKDK